jgi:chaperonin cofactor prefoldin
MDLIEHQTYNAWYKSIGNKLLDWHEARPENKDLSNILKGIEFIGLHVVKLNKENKRLELELSSIKEEISLTLNKLNKLT